jgi:hypothetical protein
VVLTNQDRQIVYIDAQAVLSRTVCELGDWGVPIPALLGQYRLPAC